MIVEDVKRDGHCLRCGAAAFTLQADNKRWACSVWGTSFKIQLLLLLGLSSMRPITCYWRLPVTHIAGLTVTWWLY